MGLFFSVSMCLAGQIHFWEIWVPAGTARTVGIYGGHDGTEITYYDLMASDIVPFSISDPSYIDTTGHTPVTPGITISDSILFTELTMHYAYIVFASIGFYAAVKLLYWN